MGNIAHLLVELQEHTNSELTMPDLSQVGGGQVAALESVLEILNGKPQEIRWESSKVTVPEDRDSFFAHIAAGGPVETVETAEIDLGDQLLSIDHPLVFIRRSVLPIDLSEGEWPKSGEDMELSAGDDDLILVTATTNWAGRGVT